MRWRVGNTMKYNVTLRASVLAHPDVAIALSHRLEVSLDCHVCRRGRRTVFMTEDAPAICTPTHHAHSARVLGKELRRSGERAEMIYRFSYEYEPFFDAKYRRDAENSLGWSRVSFDLTCPGCGEVRKDSVQQNIVRPWTCVCRCGQVLFVTDEDTPVFDAVEPAS